MLSRRFSVARGCRTLRSSHLLPSLLLAAALLGVAVTLGAAGSGAAKEGGAHDDFEQRKEQMHQRMREIAGEIDDMRKQGVDTQSKAGQRAVDVLLREYRSLSFALGGDDPAHMLGMSDPAHPALRAAAGAAQDEGAIAGAPPVPPGCTPSAFEFSNAASAPIPVIINPVVTSTIAVGGADTFLWDVNVITFIAHTAPGDLDITLTSPDGTVVTLTTDNGGDANDVFEGSLWDDDANPGGQVPYASNAGLVTDRIYVPNVIATPVAPEEPLGAFIGEDPNGIWTLTIVDDAGDDGGMLIEWSLDITTIEDAPSVTTSSASNKTPIPIPTSVALITSTISVSGLGSTLSDLDVTTFLEHTNAEDLDITLTSPEGTIVTLTTDNGLTFDNVFNGTVWNDDADPAGQVPYSSNDGMATDHPYVNNVLASPLTPEEPLAAFIGENPNGTWTLRISDDAAANGGSLESWTLTFGTISGEPETVLSTFDNPFPVPIDPPIIITSTINVAGAGAYLWDLDLTAALAHTANGDLDITLTSPAGTVVTLTTDNAAALDNVYNATAWDDDANPAGQVPYASNNGLTTDHAYANNIAATILAPEEAFGAFIGEDPNGIWTLTIHDDVRATNGGTLNNWSMALTTFPAAPVNDSPVSQSNVDSLPIAPVGTPLVTSTIPIDASGTFICDVNVTLDITHTFAADLDITLTSPEGTIVTLTTDNGSGADNVFAGTTFNDDADPNGLPPYVNNNGLATDHGYVDGIVATPLAPEEALAAFIGEDPDGNWILRISDDTTGGGGTLDSWSISITTCTCEGPPPCEGDADDSGAVDVDDLIAVILAWGACDDCPNTPCPADVAPFPIGNCAVDVDDLVAVILNWGACP